MLSKLLDSRGKLRRVGSLTLAMAAASSGSQLAAQSVSPLTGRPAAITSTAVAATSSMHDGALEIPLNVIPPHLSPPVVTALAASRDGQLIAAAGDDHVIRVIEIATGRLLNELAGHTDWIQSLVFSSESKSLYSAGNDGRVLAWDIAQSQQPVEVMYLPHAVRSLSISTKRQLLAVGGFGNEVGVWDLAAKKWHFKFPCSCSDQRCVRFCPEGDKLLAGGRDGVLHVWDTETGNELVHVQLHRDRIHTAAFSSDGNTVTSVSDDRRVVRYDLASKEVTLNREFKGAKLRSLCLINDSMIAAAGADNTIHIFAANDDVELGTLVGHTGSVAVMCSSTNYLVSGSFDTTVRVWKLEEALKPTNNGLARPVRLAPLQIDPNMEIR